MPAVCCPDHAWTWLWHDPASGHQHGHDRSAAPGLWRGIRAGQHHAAGRRLDRCRRTEHDRPDHDGGYLASHRASALAPAVAATHGYTVAFAVSAAAFGLGALLRFILLPSKPRLDQIGNAASAVSVTRCGQAEMIASNS